MKKVVRFLRSGESVFFPCPVCRANVGCIEEHFKVGKGFRCGVCSSEFKISNKSSDSVELELPGGVGYEATGSS